MKKVKRKLFSQDRKVVERYLRIAFYSRLKPLSRMIARGRMWRREREKERVLIETLSTLVRQTGKSRRGPFRSAAVVFNLSLFFLIAERDIQCVKVDALTHRDPWKRSLYARIILLTIHELDLDKVAGNRLRQALIDADVTDSMKRQVFEAMRRVRVAQQKAQKQFAFLRNATIAHRDPDALLQYRAIVGLNEMEVFKIAVEFYDGIQLFMKVMPELMLSMGTWHSLMQQLRGAHWTPKP